MSSEKKWKAMFSKTRMLLYIDGIMMILILLVVAPRLTGLGFHEIIGIILFIPVVIHLLFSWKWIRETTKRLFYRANNRTRFNYFLNFVLFILIIIEIVSGIAISLVALPSFNVHTIYDSSWRTLHNMMTNWIKITIGIHLATNWKFILSSFKNYIPQKNSTLLVPKRIISLTGLVIWRIFLIILVTLIISICIYMILGKPTLLRLYHEDAIKRFTATLGHGLIQIIGQMIFFSVVVYVSLKWFKVRL